jgi:guanosine-3',5'-bis(diphosphate) 3'-pyrophosphohydrolase
MSLGLVLCAADFAAVRHRDQRRKGAQAWPYINHPLRVAELLWRVAGVNDGEVLAAALLHDTLEDTDTRGQEITERFGARVHDLVVEMSDDPGLTARQRKAAQIASASGLSHGAALIKLADKIANVSDIVESPPRGWSLERRRDYLAWAEAVVDACPPVSPALDVLFRETLARAREGLARETA